MTPVKIKQRCRPKKTTMVTPSNSKIIKDSSQKHVIKENNPQKDSNYNLLSGQKKSQTNAPNIDVTHNRQVIKQMIENADLPIFRFISQPIAINKQTNLMYRTTQILKKIFNQLNPSHRKRHSLRPVILAQTRYLQ